MHISILWDRTEGIKGKGRVQGVVLDSMEVEPALFELRKAIEDALESLNETNISYIRRFDSTKKKS